MSGPASGDSGAAAPGAADAAPTPVWAPDPGFAPAKVNLALHVTGRRSDGYHLLDSLAAFADIGDRVSAVPAPVATLTVTGPEAAGVPTGADNLVLRAAAAFGAARGAAITLDKHLPAASGIGGGSADAAAALRVLAALHGAALPGPAAVLALGADVPLCLAGVTARMGGIGEVLSPCPPLPPVWAVLANPRMSVRTPAVFAALDCRDNPAMSPDLPRWRDAAALSAWLRGMRNDLEPPARAVCPAIGGVLAALAALPGALLARMSGSGATCFALFGAPQAAATAAAALAAAHPGWWVRPCRLGP
ncbi:MAG: 4-(cytidine 5'-diphospho)-2-C-methyl-D-erythritol kinase [Gemmobacter sp.]